MKLNKFSQAVTQDPTQPAAQAMLHAIGLTNEDFKKPLVGVASTAAGTISRINPPLKVYRDSTVEFDVSDSSLSYTKQASSYAAFELNFYRDKTFSQLYDKNQESSVFNVVRTGTVGITTDAKVTLSITPRTLQMSCTTNLIQFMRVIFRLKSNK